MSAERGTAANGQVSFWYAGSGVPLPANQLDGDAAADVCIVGAGYTGLWTAYYLARADPSLRIVICEAEFAGYGASGRNGGWLTNSITGGREGYVRSHGREAVVRFQDAMNRTVQEVMDVAAAEGIDADIVKGGELNVATNAAQLQRLTAYAEQEAQWPNADTQFLDAAETAGRIAIAGVKGGIWHPHCARIQPAKLVRGLADAVRRLGVTIHEGTPAVEIGPGAVRTTRGTVRARYVIRATEGFTAGLAGQRRSWLPLNSSMIVTEPLAAGQWEAIGWDGAETLADLAHAYIYAQRTADGRIAIGGRGDPYKFGSRTDVDGHTPEKTVRALGDMLTRLFPAVEGIGIDHAWSGVLGVPRDWHATVGLADDGVGWAGGYVGTGVATTNLAGRTLADLILGRTTELTTLPWVGRRVRKWEVEPLRWLAVKSLYATYNAADKAENRGRTTTHPVAHAADFISGKA
ncbi:NAD(P)/FAD-dependent oxidoreductase [Arthrobacter sp. HY1533]|uniref:NAD(P)/FAD-dependent oxidoreductase n=1 Tax=Arthrobacter sp. HY1533 TaxID=2970919 RepID=UPI0022B9F6C0|nr:FAD-binding oxidoreductase [Arthrobacter sp. HY1533]